MSAFILRYGLIGTAVLISVNLVMLALFGVPEPEDYRFGEIVGYTTILVAMLPVFFGIRTYRSRSRPRPGFWQLWLVGLGIAVWPALAFGVYNAIYMLYIDPDFGAKYMQYSLDQARPTMDPAAFEAYAAQLEAQQALFMNPWTQSLVMFITVFLIGAVVGIISTLILMKLSSAGAELEGGTTR